ncbi:MAG TPA: hypothetical protein PLF61_04790, partial [Candidatus Goldiibacteriota bacterium]|nr:hypothetical protein [Candidatus Goldiibacteriota bacterium]
SGPNPGSYNIPGGEARTFTWRYAATGTGTMHFTATAQGIDANQGTAVSSASEGSNLITILSPSPNFAAAISLSRQVVSTGQQLTVIMTVTNTGLINGYTSVYYTSVSYAAGGASVNALTSPSSGITINASGGVGYLTWTYSANGAGTLNFSGQAISYDGIGSTATASSSNLIIQTPSDLTAYFQTLPLSVNAGQLLTVVMVVSNNGGAAATNVRVNEDVIGTYLTKIGTADVTLVSGPSPVTQLVSGGGTGYFTFVYNPTLSGSLAFQGFVYGYDINTGLQKDSNTAQTNTIQVQSPVSLIAQFNGLPSAINLGRTFNVYFSVTNSGQSQASNVRPDPAAGTNSIARIGTGSSLYVSGPTPGPQTLSGGYSSLFSWTYSAAGTGSMYFSTRATGRDDNNLQTVYSSSKSSNWILIQKEATLVSWMSVSPTVVSEGGLITVVMSVSNDNQGGAAAMNVSPTVMKTGGTGAASLYSAPAPLTVTSIPGSGIHNFTWVYTATTAGSVWFSNNATGADANDIPQRLVTSNETCTSAVTI